MRMSSLCATRTKFGNKLDAEADMTSNAMHAPQFSNFFVHYTSPIKLLFLIMIYFKVQIVM